MTGRPIPPSELAGVAEIAAALNVNPLSVTRWRKKYPDFPAPTELACGPVWDLRKVRAWHHKHTRTRHVTTAVRCPTCTAVTAAGKPTTCPECPNG